MRNGSMLVEQFVHQDVENACDGNIVTREGRTGLVVDIVWDSDLTQRGVMTSNIRASLDNKHTLYGGGLWILDSSSALLRLVVRDMMVTVVGVTGQRYRDGYSRLELGHNEDEYATLIDPTQCVRSLSLPQLLVIEQLDGEHSRIRVLDMSTWKVTTLVTEPSPLSLVHRVYKTHNCVAKESDPKSYHLMLNTSTGPSLLDTLTGKIDSELHGLPPHNDPDELPIVTYNTPLYIRSDYNIFGVAYLLFTHQTRILSTLEEPGEYAYLKSNTTLVHANKHGIAICSKFSPYFDRHGDLKPWKATFEVTNLSVCINHDVLPGDLVLTNDASGRTWHVHTVLLESLWGYRMDGLKKMVKGCNLGGPEAIDLFIRYLHHSLGDLIKPTPDETFEVMARMVFMCVLSSLEPGRILPWFWKWYREHADDDVRALFDTLFPRLAKYRDLPADHFPGLTGLGYRNVLWFPLKPSNQSVSILDAFYNAALQRSSSDQRTGTPSTDPTTSDNDTSLSTGESTEEVRKSLEVHTLTNCTLFVVAGHSSVAIARTLHLYHRWQWFRRLIDLKECEESKTRIVHMPPWVTVNICTAILDSVMGEFQSELSAEEACTVREFGAELDVCDFDDAPKFPFTSLHTYCIDSVTKVSRDAELTSKVSTKPSSSAQ